MADKTTTKERGGRTKIVNLRDLLSTPTGMSPTSQEWFVVHDGHQTVLDARDPFARSRLKLQTDRSLDPIKERELRVKLGALVMEELEKDRAQAEEDDED